MPAPRAALRRGGRGLPRPDQVGRGGDWVVYRARQESIGRDVAIKVVDIDLDPPAVRFTREIEITVELGRQHPDIVTVLAVGTTASSRPAIVMDYFDGGTLHDRLRHGPLPPEEVARIGGGARRRAVVRPRPRRAAP